MAGLCKGCMRESHPGLSCTENALRKEYGKRDRKPPVCRRCMREHWPFQRCTLRSRQEEEQYRKLGG